MFHRVVVQGCNSAEPQLSQGYIKGDIRHVYIDGLSKTKLYISQAPFMTPFLPSNKGRTKTL